MFILTFGAPLPVFTALPLCLYGFDTRKGLPCAALCNARIGAAAPLDYGGCVFYFHFGGVYQTLVRCYSRVWFGVLSDVSVVGHADSDFGIDSATLGLL